jgi:hypothetical protein
VRPAQTSLSRLSFAQVSLSATRCRSVPGGPARHRRHFRYTKSAVLGNEKADSRKRSNLAQEYEDRANSAAAIINKPLESPRFRFVARVSGFDEPSVLQNWKALAAASIPWRLTPRWKLYPSGEVPPISAENTGSQRRTSSRSQIARNTATDVENF